MAHGWPPLIPGQPPPCTEAGDSPKVSNLDTEPGDHRRWPGPRESPLQGRMRRAGEVTVAPGRARGQGEDNSVGSLGSSADAIRASRGPQRLPKGKHLCWGVGLFSTTTQAQLEFSQYRQSAQCEGLAGGTYGIKFPSSCPCAPRSNSPHAVPTPALHPVPPSLGCVSSRGQRALSQHCRPPAAKCLE